jgi:diguanylate cyclase (GGDEF)-like protein
MAVRYGGEEFVAVMPGADARTAAVRADEWRRRCADITAATPQGMRITFSAGVAQLLPGESAEELLRLADAALYRAKNSGRDRVETADRTPQFVAEALGEWASS